MNIFRLSYSYGRHHDCKWINADYTNRRSVYAEWTDNEGTCLVKKVEIRSSMKSVFQVVGALEQLKTLEQFDRLVSRRCYWCSPWTRGLYIWLSRKKKRALFTSKVWRWDEGTVAVTAVLQTGKSTALPRVHWCFHRLWGPASRSGGTGLGSGTISPIDPTDSRGEALHDTEKASRVARRLIYNLCQAIQRGTTRWY